MLLSELVFILQRDLQILLEYLDQPLDSKRLLDRYKGII
jgi:hypothetical protein